MSSLAAASALACTVSSDRDISPARAANATPPGASSGVDRVRFLPVSHAPPVFGDAAVARALGALEIGTADSSGGISIHPNAHVRPDGSGTVVVERAMGGLAISGEKAAVVLGPGGRPVATVGDLAPLRLRANNGAPMRDAEATVRAFASKLGLAKVERGPAADTWRAGDPHGSRTATIAAKPALHRVGEELVHAFALDVATFGPDGVPDDRRDVVVDARDSSVIEVHTRRFSHSFRVWADAEGRPLDAPGGNGAIPHPHGVPDGFVPAVVPTRLVATDGFLAGAPWLLPNATEASGNNARAGIRFRGWFRWGDSDPPDPDAFLVPISSEGTFDRQVDPTLPFDTKAAGLAVATQAFYIVNYLHDWFYESGFTEARKNPQRDNFGLGGKDGDPINIEVFPLAADNAWTHVTPDGVSPTLAFGAFSSVRTNSVIAIEGGAILDGDLVAYRVGPSTFDVRAPLVAPRDDAGHAMDGCDPAALRGVSLGGRVVAVPKGPCGIVAQVERIAALGAVAVVLTESSEDSKRDLPSQPIAIPVVIGTPEHSAQIVAASGQPVRLTGARERWRSSALDVGVVAHEWGHVLAGRLAGPSPTCSEFVCTSYSQGRGIHEGWADFVALLVEVRKEDVAADGLRGAYTAGGHVDEVKSAAPYYFGTRRVPYSVDPAKNALTFRHIRMDEPLPTTHPVQPHGSFGYAEAHDVGEVWTTMLFECYSELLDPERGLGFAEANARMRRYLVDSLQVTPIDPVFTSARDALLATAAARDPEDARRFAAAFARRGLGVDAKSPWVGSESNVGLVEGFAPWTFDVLGFSSRDDGRTCDADGVLDAGERGHMHMDLALRSLVPPVELARDAMVHIVSEGTPLVVHGGPKAVHLEGSARVGLDFDVELTAGVSSGRLPVVIELTHPSLRAPERRTVTLRVDHDTGPATTECFEESLEGRWATSTPASEPPESGWKIVEFGERFASIQRAPIADAFNLTSPPIHVPAGTALELRFQERRRNQYNGGIEISTDEGASWTDIFAVAVHEQADCAGQVCNFVPPETPNYPAFVPFAITLDPKLGGQTVRVRFVSYGGQWDIDDFEAIGASGTPFDSCVPNACRPQEVDAGADAGTRDAAPPGAPAATPTEGGGSGCAIAVRENRQAALAAAVILFGMVSLRRRRRDSGVRG
ncbi:M36 family metallopeptidase [Pendulispora brunnea]|uniref:M36 family metallopeptidase n=1 Tax=Pendulispora brunnea TaxID=2905690 RepID=A0ABZ2JYT1_9BACT